MAVRLDVQADVKQALKKLGLEKDRVLRAASQALNRTGDQVRTAAVAEISTREGVKVSDVRKYVTVRKRANRRSLRVEVDASGKAPNLIEWVQGKTKADIATRFRSKPGVEAKVFGKVNTYDRTFIVKGKNSGKWIVVTRRDNARRAKGKWKPGWSKGIYGPPPKREFARAVIFGAMDRVARERWPINWRQALNFALSERSRR